MRWWAAWVRDRGALASFTVMGGVGAAAGVLLALGAASADTRLAEAESAATVGAALGGLLGAVAWSACWLVASDSAGPRSPSERLYEDFCRYNQGRLRSQWQVLLDGRERLPAPFTGYNRIAPPWRSSGALRQRSDLAGALEAARALGGGPRLLVIGPAGYGKSVALLDIAQHLAHTGGFGAPVVFHLGSWRAGDDLAAWMVRVLCDPTGPLPGAKRVVSRWVRDGRIAPLLDGLDEIVDDDLRRACVAAVNAFVHHAVASTAVVVASRPAEYTAISRPRAACLAVNAAIELQALRPALVTGRLADVAADDGRGAQGLADLVGSQPDHPAAQLLRVPLWLWLATTSDAGDTTDLKDAADADAAQAVLAGAFVERSVADLDHRTGLGPAACHRSLAAIAGFLADPRSPDSVTFRLEDLTPSQPSRWLTTAAGLVGGLAFGVLFGLLGGPIVGLAVVAAGVLFGQPEAALTRTDGAALPKRSRLRWAGTARFARGLLLGAAYGFLGGLIGSLVGSGDGLVSTLVGGLIGALIGGIAGGLASGLFGSDDVTPEDIDDGLAASRRSWLVQGALSGLLGGLIVGLIGGIVFGPIGAAVYLVVAVFVSGPLDGLREGGWYVMLQRRVRRRAHAHGLLPEDPAAFLRAACLAGILRQTGSGTQFRHRALADQLARQAPAPGLADQRP